MIEIEGPDGTIYEFPAGTDQDTMRSAMQKVYGEPQPAAQAAPDPYAQPQIVGDTIVPPPPGPEGYQETPQQGGFSKGDMYNLSDQAHDIVGAGLAGLSRGVTGLADVPGMARGAVNSLMLGGLQQAGVISPETAQAGVQYTAQQPLGGGNLAGDITADLTDGASEYRSDTTAGQYAGTVGEFVPGALMGPGGPVSNAIRYGVIPGLASETAGQATEGTSAEPVARALAAVAASPVAGLAERGGRRLISPHGGADEGRLALANVLEDAGVPVSAGQKVGSTSLQRKEGLTTAGQELNAAQREALTAAALRTTGTDATRATPDVLAEASRRIGSVFDDVTAGVDVTPDAGTVQALTNANQTYRQLAPKANQAPIVGQVVREVEQAVNSGSTIPATTMNSWRSNLSKLTTSSDSATRTAAAEALEAIDGAMTSTLTNMGRVDDVARLATAREQWRNLLAIQRAATGAGELAATGILSPSALRNAVVQQGRSAYAQGRRGELGDLSRAGEGVIRPLPTSGTAENLRAMGVPALGWGGAGAAAGTMMAGPAGSAIGAMTGAILPQVLGAARMTQPVQRYLSNQMVGRGGDILSSGQISPIIRALTEMGMGGN